MEQTEALQVSIEKLLPILDEIEKLSYNEKKALLEILSIDLEEMSRLKHTNWDNLDENTLRDLVNNIISDFK